MLGEGRGQGKGQGRGSGFVSSSEIVRGPNAARNVASV